MNPYLTEKSRQAALALTRSYDIRFADAIRMTTRLWEEARRMVLTHVTAEEWRKLSRQDKAAICAELVRALTDRKKLIGFLDGSRKGLQ